MSEAPRFPPLLRGVAVPAGTDPLLRAEARAREGCDAGTLFHDIRADRLRAAIVFAPEVPLERAMVMLPLCAVGFQNALGALAPPEVGVHLGWDGALYLNGAKCGRLRVRADPVARGVVPGWLVIGLDLRVMMFSDAPGDTPERTSLHDEGCAGIAPVQLLEAWARHMLVWINRWSDEGAAPLHGEWTGLARDLGRRVEFGGQRGTFLGVDEHFGMLLRDGDTTRLIPLTTLIEGR